jgi:hypothetical protein
MVDFFGVQVRHQDLERSAQLHGGSAFLEPVEQADAVLAVHQDRGDDPERENRHEQVEQVERIERAPPAEQQQREPDRADRNLARRSFDV